MLLNSVILGNILNNENCELKNSIDAYMDNKIKDFQVMMKKSVDDIINTKVNTFCNKPFDKHESILFNEDGSKIIEGYNRYALNYNHQNPTSTTQFQLTTNPTKNNIKCFTTIASNNGYAVNSPESITCYYFLNFMIKCTYINYGNHGSTSYTRYDYELTIDNLFVIKHFQSLDLILPHRRQKIENGLSLHKTHPEYFKKSYSELDEKKEYIEIEKLMNELKILIDDNKQKKEYYESLEKRNIELEAEVKQLQNKATEIDEIKSLLKDQQEYAHIIQSLLKKINKLENKAIENE